MASSRPGTIRIDRIGARYSVRRSSSVAEVAAMIATCSGSAPHDLRDRALIEVMYSTGARASELMGLELRDVDLERGAVLIRGKGGKCRFAVLGPSAADALWSMPALINLLLSPLLSMTYAPVFAYIIWWSSKPR